MNRRQLLKLGSVIPLVAALPKVARATEPPWEELSTWKSRTYVIHTNPAPCGRKCILTGIRPGELWEENGRGSVGILMPGTLPFKRAMSRQLDSWQSWCPTCLYGGTIRIDPWVFAGGWRIEFA